MTHVGSVFSAALALLVFGQAGCEAGVSRAPEAARAPDPR